ncbi:hypothetical protein [Pseudomonas brenneri]|uniref:hypothetical protein n=1 Tax=Pseudomonas brenneri TaxID=129817 RepID=UPI003BA0DD99
MKSEISDNDTYIDRNSRWLLPLLASFMLLSAPALIEIVGNESPIPVWVTSLFAAIGFGASGVFAMFTETFSAHVVRWLAEILAIAVLVGLFWKLFSAAA